MCSGKQYYLVEYVGENNLLNKMSMRENHNVNEGERITNFKYFFKMCFVNSMDSQIPFLVSTLTKQLYNFFKNYF